MKSTHETEKKIWARLLVASFVYHLIEINGRQAHKSFALVTLLLFLMRVTGIRIHDLMSE